VKVHPDFEEFVDSLNAHDVDFVVVGAFALAFHGHPRATGGLAAWIRPDHGNAGKSVTATETFGFESLGLHEDDLLSGKVIQLGHPPVRIDLLTNLDGLDTEEIWAGKVPGKFGKHDIFYIGRDEFIRNKRAVGRHQDLADLELLGELQ